MGHLEICTVQTANLKFEGRGFSTKKSSYRTVLKIRTFDQSISIFFHANFTHDQTKKLTQHPGSQIKMSALQFLLRSDLQGRPRSSARHGRRCRVCHHPEREAIENAFLNWESADTIARDFGIADHSSIYRHAHATGLFSRRSGHVRYALDRIIEQVHTAKVTGDHVIKAIRAAGCLTGDGKWVEPVRKIIYTTEPPSPPSAPQNPNSQPND